MHDRFTLMLFYATVGDVSRLMSTVLPTIVTLNCTSPVTDGTIRLIILRGIILEFVKKFEPIAIIKTFVFSLSGDSFDQYLLYTFFIQINYFSFCININFSIDVCVWGGGSF